MRSCITVGQLIERLRKYDIQLPIRFSVSIDDIDVEDPVFCHDADLTIEKNGEEVVFFLNGLEEY